MESIDKHSVAFQNVAATHLAPPETKASIMSVLNQKIGMLSSKVNLVSMLSESSFDIEKIRDEKTIIYFIGDNIMKAKIVSVYNLILPNLN